MTTTPYVDLATVHSPTSGATPPVAWGTDIRNNLQILANPPGCKVARTTSQALVTAVFSNISFTAADTRDTDAFHDTTTNPDRLIVPTGLGGLYAIACVCSIAANATGIRQMFIQVNGSTTHKYVNCTSPTTGIEATLNIYDEIALNAGDYVNFLVIQTSGGNLNITGAEAILTWRGVA